MSPDPLAPYDAVVLLSFGGPEKPDDVVPFLENVTAGKGIPRERLLEVGEHYFAFGGRSPINDQNKALLAALEARMREVGSTVPIRWGNRNWEPYLNDVVRELAENDAQRLLVLTTSVYSSYSSCRQYRENLAAAQSGLLTPPQLDQIRRSYNLPGFIEANADAVRQALQGGEAEPAQRLLFVTHSIPTAMADSAGVSGGAYVEQHEWVAQAVAESLRDRGVPIPEWELVYCSRSGPPSQPWLEPDVNDRLEELAADGVTSVVLAPIGFISDHMEVIYDLDTEARDTCQRLGLAMRRAATAGTHPAFVNGLVDRLLERAQQARGERELDANAMPICADTCCPNLRTHRPAACEGTWSDAQAS